MRIETYLKDNRSRIFVGRDGTKAVDIVFVEGDTESGEEVSVCVTLSNEHATSLRKKLQFVEQTAAEVEDE